MFAAVFALGQGSAQLDDIDVSILFDSLDPFNQADGCGQRQDGQSLIAQCVTWNTHDSKFQALPHTCQTSGRVIASWSRLDNRAELMAQLGHAEHQSDEISDAALLATAYERWGQRCTNHLVGAFSFFVYDPRTKSLFIARDHVGFRPLFYACGGGLLVVSTSAAVFHKLPQLALSPSQEWIAQFITRSAMSHIATPWPQVKKLASGHQILVDDITSMSTSVTPLRYFSFSEAAPSMPSRSSDWVGDYRTRLDQAVRCRLRTSYQLGAETTGGLDSSTCLGLAARLSDRPLDELHAFGFVFREDEPDFIFETSRMHNIGNDHIAQAERDSYTEAIDRSIRLLGYPMEQGNAVGHETFYQQCDDLGVRTLLSGYGGDQGVTSEAHLWYNELVQRRQLLTLWRRLSDEPGRRSSRLVRLLAKSQVRKHQASRYATAMATRWPHYPLRSDVIERFALEKHYALASRYDEDISTINQFVIEQLTGADIPTRLENSVLMANSYKVEYRWPLLDVRLIQQYLSTPSGYKRGRGMGRFLHRAAVAGVVPENIRWKDSKAMGPMLNSPLVATHSTNVEQALSTLHPLVSEVIDITRLRTLAKDLDDGPADSVSPAAVATIRTARNIGNLNRWLNARHP